ncbi:hypothetical protein HHK36_013837 [Tetracentron sinense]|uniref:poly(A)-specific ribonuclease n=1 Tax=Tetracentron sinense TaxID=13715 RepID=A0A834Z8V4_TETSI|nr:hypothetical protein HHK36_013837 [Tetracentron sinense]
MTFPSSSISLCKDYPDLSIYKSAIIRFAFSIPEKHPSIQRVAIVRIHRLEEGVKNDDSYNRKKMKAEGIECHGLVIAKVKSFLNNPSSSVSLSKDNPDLSTYRSAIAECALSILEKHPSIQRVATVRRHLLERGMKDDESYNRLATVGLYGRNLYQQLGFSFGILQIWLKEMSIFPKRDSIHIREVWNDNLEDEFALIQEIVDDYPYIAMDTEFPGIVLRPVGNFKNSTDYHYQTLKANVDLLKLIQLGLTFSDDEGNLPTCGTDQFCVWQFNFGEFNVLQDVFANDSVELLRQSGIDFQKNNEKGIDAGRFGELLMSSGIVLNDSVHWVTFHSGYDFGYLLKLLSCQNLPDTQIGFFKLITMYFPNLYDIKYLMKFCNSLHGGLNKLAELLEVERIGICHQAGSDSLLTSFTFRKLKENFFDGSPEKYAGVLYGLGVENGQNTH